MVCLKGKAWARVIAWRDWCEGKCKRFISVFPPFFAVKDQCPWANPACWYPKLFLFGDMHYTAAGNALVAAAVIKSLEESPPIKSQPQVSGSQRQTVVQSCRPSSRRSLQLGDSSQNSLVVKRNCPEANGSGT